MTTNERKPRPHYYVESRRPGTLWETRWMTVRPAAALDAIRAWADECPSLEWRVATYVRWGHTDSILAYRPAVVQ